MRLLRMANFCFVVRSENISTLSTKSFVLSLFFYLIPFITDLNGFDFIKRSLSFLFEGVTFLAVAVLLEVYIKANSPKESPPRSTFFTDGSSIISISPSSIIKKQAPLSPSWKIYLSGSAVAVPILAAISTN